MTDQTTTRLAEIAARLNDLDQAEDYDRNRLLALVWHHAPADLAHLLALVEQLQTENGSLSDQLDQAHDQRSKLAEQVDKTQAHFREYITTHKMDSANVRAERDKAQAEVDRLQGQLDEVTADRDRFQRAENRRLEAALAKASPIAPSANEALGVSGDR